MELRPLGRTSMRVSPIGFGAFKIGRNEKVKYPTSYDLPDEEQTQGLLRGLIDLGVRYFDTAPAYGVSEERLGRYLSDQPDIVISTKVGETFENGRSIYAFDRRSVEASLDRSRARLNRDVLDLVFVHSDGRDLAIQRETDVLNVLREQRQRSEIRAIGFSGKAVDGARAALDWADAIMVEYHARDTSHDAVMREAAQHGVAVIVKKGLAAGHLQADQAIAFALRHPAVTSLVIGGLNLEHMAANVAAARRALGETT